MGGGTANATPRPWGIRLPGRRATRGKEMHEKGI